ncbi:MAG: hypothetical protein HQP61_02405 [Peptococcaceae bacterium]|nr:hypothetical protein [Candidatus Syntrophopropionicum ammoniitolerans]
MSNLPMVLPVCPASAEHGEMVLRPLAFQTYEQKFCGTWYDCPQCRSSILFPSMELSKVNEEVKK